MKKVVVFFMLILVVGIASGCSEKSVYKQFNQNYDEAYEKMVNHETRNDLKGLNSKERAYRYLIDFLGTAKPVCLGIACISFIVGLIIFKTIEKDKKIRKTAVVTLMIGVPLICLIIVGGTASIARMIK